MTQTDPHYPAFYPDPDLEPDPDVLPPLDDPLEGGDPDGDEEE